MLLVEVVLNVRHISFMPIIQTAALMCYYGSILWLLKAFH